MIGGEDGQKMSKSRGNVVNPDDVVDKYGADSFRLYEMFMGPLDKSKPWSTKGLQGCYRFTQKLWKLYTENDKMSDEPPSKETLRILHQTIKKVTNDLDTLSFNTAVSQMMIFVNHMLVQEEYNSDVPSGNVTWQYPKGGDMLNKGMGLHLTISLGVPPNFFQVPNLFGLSKKKAVADLERAGFKLGKTFYRQNEDLIPYTVLDQSIPAETVLEKPTNIDLTISVLDMQDIFNQMIK